MSVVDAAQGARGFKRRILWTLLLATLLGMGLVAGGWAWWIDRRYKVAMDEIEADIVTGRYAIACRKLDNLLSWKSDWNGGLTYLLGSCELARGRSNAAAAAWARISPGIGFSEKAIRGRMRVLKDAGQFAAAEQLIIEGAGDPRNDRTALGATLVPMFREQGRIDSAGRLIEERWEYLNGRREGALEPAIKLLLQHLDLTLNELPVDNLRPALDRAAKLAPQDDRVWLGRADLCIRTGLYNDAERWLLKCLERRPADVSVWHARLKLAMATGQVGVVNEAMTHLTDLKSNHVRAHQVRAWLSAHRADSADERVELELVVTSNPADLTSLARLAELAEKSGQRVQAADFNRRQSQAKQRLARYRQLFESNQPIRNAHEMAQLAGQLGRQFESRAFRTIATSNTAIRKIRRPDRTQ